MKTFISLLFILSLSFAAYAAGEVDQSFNASVYRQSVPGGFSGSIATGVFTSALQPDGKLLIGGLFSVVNGAGRGSVARFNTDGTLDTSFNPPDLYDLNNTLNPGNVYSVALQSNGKIIVGGSFGVVGSTYRSLIRLNSDGSLDTTFNNLSAQFEPTELIYEVTVRPNDTIYISGYVELSGGAGFLTSGVARFDSNGVLDTTFQLTRSNQFSINTVKSIAVTSDNLIYTAVPITSSSSYLIGRYNSNGIRDTAFPQITANGEVLRLIIQPDGKILVGGGFTRLNDFNVYGIARITSEGAIDTNFNQNGTGTIYAGVFDVNITPDGKIIVAGSFSGYNSTTQVAIVKLNTDGTRDTSFNSPFPTINSSRTVEVQSDGKIILAGGGVGLVRINQNGTLDSTYPRNIFGAGGSVKDIVQQPDGKIIAGGNFSTAGSSQRVSLVRFNTDGSVDATFSPIFLASDAIVYKIALQSSGKILVGGALSNTTGNNEGIVRFNLDGSRDTSFTRYFNTSVRDLEVLADDKIIVNGTTRLTADGAADSSYSSQTLLGGAVLTTRLQPDGKVLIGGTFTQVGSVLRGRIARLNTDGTVDTTFAPPQGANGAVNDIDLQTDGKIIVVGAFTSLNGDTSKAYIGRLNSDGSLDTSFSPTTNNQINTIKVQPDGKLLIGGIFTQINGAARNYYARLNANGTTDPTFTEPSGANNAVNKITLQADGKILLGGDFTRVNGLPAIGIARLLNAAAAARTRFDFDGDGRADVAVFRPSNGNWFVLPSQTNSFYGFPFGQASDQIAPADFDGDGKTDVAVFRDNVAGAGDKAYFYILNSSDNSFRPAQFGTQGDVPMTGDWDGDGKADLAVYRAATTSGGQSYFYYRPSSQPTVDYLSIALGTLGDKPLLGDFDGDGRLDPAVFRASTATWYIIKSSVNQLQQTTFGVSTDIPVPADYDGDGAANIAVFRPSNGYWYTSQNPATNYGAIQFGASSDLPVAADFDGDGKADVAIFRPSSGAWYVNRTTAGFYGVQFGANQDKPVPNAFIR